ncbi:hypothetical protein [Nonlabens agnitus]|uniref:Methyltransferase n=1 Tax=Nonlabens agnitus TaxID=870484 RepID=A0A2S9WWB9_9FLAO|nr:hypothetical protein [Nonlabens agnitus]PRP67777.1 hypothetical protein BST86_12080 [Nonlabens agnitus]
MRDLIKRCYYQFPTVRKVNESVWANVFHDSIKQYAYLDRLSLNVGRFSANYTLLYLLHRIIDISNPKRLLELGLGESSKFISTYLKHEHNTCNHIIVEHDKDWVTHFSKFALSECSEIQMFEVKKGSYLNKYRSCNYVGFEQLGKSGKFQMIVIDGPLGTKQYSRNDVLQHLEALVDFKNFIIVFDDTQRKGEHQTFKAMCKQIKQKGVSYGSTTYYGDKFVSLIYSSNYDYLNTL